MLGNTEAEMKNWERDKLKAEIAAKLLAAIIVEQAAHHIHLEAASDRRHRQMQEAIWRAEHLLDFVGLAE